MDRRINCCRIVAFRSAKGDALPNDRAHAPNEKFHLPNFDNGITTCAWFLHALGFPGKIESVEHGRHHS
jgi:acetylornithine deacetylase/succinyl-diaminopimelate desuccinylase-like protein